MLSADNAANCFVCEHRNEFAAQKDLVVFFTLRNNVDDHLQTNFDIDAKIIDDDCPNMNEAMLILRHSGIVQFDSVDVSICSAHVKELVINFRPKIQTRCKFHEHSNKRTRKGAAKGQCPPIPLNVILELEASGETVLLAGLSNPIVYFAY